MNEKLRILHIVQGLNMGGIETLLMNLYRNIDREILQFDFLVSCIDKSYYEDEVLSLGGRIFRMSPIKMLSPHKYLNDVNRFFIEHPQYKIVHSHMNAVSALPLYIAKKNQIPIRICHSHSNKAIGFKGILKRVLKYPLRYYANNYFACSNDAANFLYGKWFFSNPNCFILNNAINAELYVYNPSTQSKIKKKFKIENKTVIGHVGRFSSVKNHTFILEIFKIVHKKNPETILMLIGDGELRLEIEEKISRLGLTDSVIITGFVKNVYDYLQAMDIYLFPSLYEGLGMSLVEAQAAGLKSLATDTITKESVVSDLVEFISLLNKADFWANRIINIGNKYERKNMLFQVQKAGYDIKITSKWLQNYYIKAMNKC